MDAEFDLANNQNCWVAVTGKHGASSTKSIGSVFADIDVNLDGNITMVSSSDLKSERTGAM